MSIADDPMCRILNPLSRKVHSKLGTREIGELTSWRFLFFTRTRFTPIDKS